MNYKVEVSDYFKKELKRLIKKYHSLTKELDELINKLSIDPIQGTPIGNNLFIRFVLLLLQREREKLAVLG